MSDTHPPASGTPSPPTGADPSMEDILASIRRILSEDEPAEPQPDAAQQPAVPSTAPPALDPMDEDEDPDDVLVLDNSMRAEDPAPEPEALPEPEPVVLPEPLPEALPPPPPAQLFAEPELLGPEAAAAASSSVGNLMRTLAADRSTFVYRGGPTIEDLVREELRPLLKQWLDTNLPPLVERLVRTEIERVVGRAVP